MPLGEKLDLVAINRRIALGRIEPGLFRSLDLCNLAVMHHDLNRAITQRCDLFADDPKPLGKRVGQVFWRWAWAHEIGDEIAVLIANLFKVDNSDMI